MTAGDPDKPMSFSSLNGDIDVSLPSDIKANLSMKSDNGEIYSDFGGPEMQFKTFTGNIYIRKSSK